MKIELNQLRPLACETRAHCRACRTDSAWRERVVGVPDFDCPHRVYWDGKRLRTRLRGLGDVVEILARKLGFEKKPGCGCRRRQEKLNRWFKFRR